jgi:hypothetical protein
VGEFMLKTNHRRIVKTHILQRALIAALVVLLPARASTLVVIWTPDKIVFAADGRLTLMDSTGKILEPSGTVCKIKTIGSVLWGSAGLYEFPASGFNLSDILKKRIGRS